MHRALTAFLFAAATAAAIPAAAIEPSDLTRALAGYGAACYEANGDEDLAPETVIDTCRKALSEVEVVWSQAEKPSLEERNYYQFIKGYFHAVAASRYAALDGPVSERACRELERQWRDQSRITADTGSAQWEDYSRARERVQAPLARCRAEFKRPTWGAALPGAD